MIMMELDLTVVFKIDGDEQCNERDSESEVVGEDEERIALGRGMKGVSEG